MVRELVEGRLESTSADLNLSEGCLRSLDGRILFWSSGNEQLYGWSSEEAIGRMCHLLLATRFSQPVEELNAQLTKTAFWSGELIQRTKAGHELRVASQCILQLDSGRCSRIVQLDHAIRSACVPDAMRAADEAGNYWKSLVDSSDDAIISKNLQGQITTWNSGAERLFGYTPGEIIGKSVLALFPPELIKEEGAILSRILSGGHIQHYETTRITKAGRRIAVSLTISPIYNNVHEVIGASKIVRDISQKKRLENALRESEWRRKLAIEAGEVGIWHYNAVSQVSDWSPRCKAIFGLPPDSPCPSYEDSLQRLNPEDTPEVRRAFQQALEDGTSFDVEFRIIDPTGITRWVQSKGNPFRGPDGNVVEINGAIVDLTLRKQAEEVLRRSNSQLQQFAYAAAHDLQEPLRNVALSIELAKLQVRGQIDKETATLLDTAVQSARKMEGMVRDLLAYSKVLHENANRSSITQTNEVLASALENLSVAIRESAAQVTHDELPILKIDKSHLLQLFQNLIANALKYRSAELPRIHISSCRKSNGVQFSVKDNGLGINPEYHKRVFGMFKRLRENDAPGSGLGLTLCKRIVEHYGGDIWLDSDGKNGSTFFFTLSPAERSCHVEP